MQEMNIQNTTTQVSLLRRFGGQVAVITGSGRHNGIGEAIALKLATEGCNLVISDIGEAKGESFSAEHIGATAEMNEIALASESLGVKVITVPCDVRNENDCANSSSTRGPVIKSA